jgi:hypothetical protein
MSGKEKMKYRIEYYPNGDIVTIHSDQRMSVKPKTYGDDLFSGLSLKESLKTGPSFIKSILVVRGVKSVSINGYEVRIEKGSVFQWDDILGKALAIINVEFDPKGMLEEIAPPKKPSQAYLRSLEHSGSDIDPFWMSQCPLDEDS